MRKFVIACSLLSLALAAGTVQAAEPLRTRTAVGRQPAGKLKGVVQCTTSGPVAGAVISLQPGGLFATSDTAGAFMINRVPGGSYTVSVLLNGTVAKTVTNVNVRMRGMTNMGIVSVVCVQPCTVNDTCPTGSFCAKAMGECAAPGTCAVMPALCTALYDPVCGCDGRTYTNDCEAAMAGVAVAAQGACAVTPPPPAACADKTQCAAAEFCSRPAGVCAGDGTCAARPTLCTSVYDPVCGCDGRTYTNDCEAAMAGVTVSAQGACAVTPPLPAACADNTQCAAAEFCSRPAGVCAGDGTCAARPGLCIALYDPVCGCDGITYSNSCESARAGTGVAYTGSCATIPQPAGCTSNNDCAVSQYCSKPAGDCAGTGTCQPRPEICSMLFDPVPGCDGIMYTNSCEAARAGVSLK